MDWWAYENESFSDGWQIVCGVDEAGRGCLAGPVYAAAVILPPGVIISGLNDSKKLSAQRREMLFDVITQTAVSCAVGTATAREIDDVNILNATFLAMNRAIEALDLPPEVALIDGNRATGVTAVCRCIVGGDGKSASIAAASILAKVSRDRFMRTLALEYPEYLFDVHKGYGTKVHYERIAAHGPSPVHRRSFLKKLFGGGADRRPLD
ncbi:ribonuclease HII [Oscillospiraceae bacterium WX1]